MVHSSRSWQKTLPQARNQAYHDKWEKQQDDHDKGCMSSKNDDHSSTGNIPNIVEMSFTQMEG